MLGEPTYTFIRGQGWILTREPIIMEILERDLQVGDIVIGWTFNAGHYDEHGHTYKISRIDGNQVYEQYGAFEGYFHTFGTVLTWKIIRQ